jgi:hypothetical protein
MQHFRRAVQTDPGNAAVRRQLVNVIDRRLAVAGIGTVGVGVVGGGLVTDTSQPVTWAIAVALVAVVLVGIAGLRWWRLRQLDETLRTFYRHERRRWRALRRHLLACAAVVVVASLAAIAAVASVSRSWPATVMAAVVVMLLLRYPGLGLWRREVLPKLQARYGVLRVR